MTVLLWQDFAPGCYETSSDTATHVQTSKWAALQFTECQNTHSLLLIVETVNVHQKLGSKQPPDQTRPFPVRNR